MRSKGGKPKSRREEGAEIIDKLTSAVEALDAKAGVFNAFGDLPLCQATLEGLRLAKYTTLTPIQARALPLALKGLFCFLASSAFVC